MAAVCRVGNSLFRSSIRYDCYLQKEQRERITLLSLCKERIAPVALFKKEWKSEEQKVIALFKSDSLFLRVIRSFQEWFALFKSDSLFLRVIRSF